MTVEEFLQSYGGMRLRIEKLKIGISLVVVCTKLNCTSN